MWPCLDRPRWLTMVSTWAAGLGPVIPGPESIRCCWLLLGENGDNWWKRWVAVGLQMILRDDWNWTTGGASGLAVDVVDVAKMWRTLFHKAAGETIRLEQWKNKWSLSGLGLTKTLEHRWQTYRSPAWIFLGTRKGISRRASIDSENQKYNRWLFSTGRVVVKINDKLWILAPLDCCWDDDGITIAHSTFCIRHSVATSMDIGHRLDDGLELNSPFLKVT